LQGKKLLANVLYGIYKRKLMKKILIGSVHSGFSRKGQSLVEFALTLPIFLVVVFGAIDMARYYHTQEQMTHIIRSALRKAVVYRTDDSTNTLTRREYFIQEAEKATVNLSLVMPPTNPGSASASDSIVMDPSNCGEHDQDVTVTIQKSFTFVTPFINEIAQGAGASYPYTMKVVIKSRVEP
jgi:hypothetical protein